MLQHAIKIPILETEAAVCPLVSKETALISTNEGS